jgi:hypothetical protein
LFISKYLHVAEARAAEVPRQQPDTGKKKAATHGIVIKPVPPQHPSSVFVMVGNQYVKVAYDKIPPDAYYPGGIPAGADAKARAAAESTARGRAPMPPAANGVPGTNPPPMPAPVPAATAAVPAPVSANPMAAIATGPAIRGVNVEIMDAHNRLDEARRLRNRFAIEIQKKFSIAAACIVFVLVGAPVALRFPRGGVGLVIGVSFFVFAAYYVGLNSGESLANRNIVSPFFAMWIANIIFLVVGLLLITRMGKEGVTTRGGRLAEIVESLRARLSRRTRQSTS